MKKTAAFTKITIPQATFRMFNNTDPYNWCSNRFEEFWNGKYTDWQIPDNCISVQIYPETVNLWVKVELKGQEKAVTPYFTTTAKTDRKFKIHFRDKKFAKKLFGYDTLTSEIIGSSIRLRPEEYNSFLKSLEDLTDFQFYGKLRRNEASFMITSALSNRTYYLSVSRSFYKGDVLITCKIKPAHPELPNTAEQDIQKISNLIVNTYNLKITNCNIFSWLDTFKYTSE